MEIENVFNAKALKLGYYCERKDKLDSSFLS
jgi:hypothetical protein